MLAIRDANGALLDRAEKVDTPGQMEQAQAAVTQTLTLRRDALSVIAQNVGDATANAETADAIDHITTQMGSLYASDVLWSQIGSPDIKEVLTDENVDAGHAAAGEFHARRCDQLSGPDIAVAEAQQHRRPADHAAGPTASR